MATLDWRTTGEGEVTLVHLLVTSETRERVRVGNCLDGPVWPPRRQGVPAEGWDDDGFEGVVTPSDRLVLGYASPAAPTDPPARIVSTEPAPNRNEPVTARDVVRTLGDPRPPRDAIPRDARQPTERVPVDGSASAGKRGQRTRNVADETQPESGPRQPQESEGKAATAVMAWLDDVAERVDDAEQLAAASSVPEASAAVDAVGDLEGVSTLDSRLTADRERLATVAERSRLLAARIEELDVPVETLRRLA